MKRFAGTVIAAAMIAVTSATPAISGDWTGGYAGVFYGLDAGGIGSDLYGVRVGYNWQSAKLVYGGEVTVNIATAGTGVSYQFDGRLGMPVADNVLLFATGGVSSWLGTTAVDIGAGAEFAVSDAVSLRADYQYYIPTNGATGVSAVKFGLSYGF